MKGVGLFKITHQLSRFLGLESRPLTLQLRLICLLEGSGGGSNHQAQPQDWLRWLRSQEQPNTFAPSASWES